MTSGPLAVLVLGLVLLLAASLRDRHTRRASESPLGAPPERPELAAMPAPSYLGQPPEQPRARLGEDLSGQLAAWKPRATRLPARLLDERFLTHGRLGLARAPFVLVCGERIGSMHELLPVCSYAQKQSRPLVILCTDMAPEVSTTLAANKDAGLLEVVVVRHDEDSCDGIADALAAPVVSRAKLQSRANPTPILGSAELLVSDLTSTWVEA